MVVGRKRIYRNQFIGESEREEKEKVSKLVVGIGLQLKTFNSKVVHKVVVFICSISFGLLKGLL